MGSPGLLRYGIHAGGDASARLQSAFHRGAGDRVHRGHRRRSELRGCPAESGIPRTSHCGFPPGGFARNLMFDAQIAALCREHGIDTILTNDRDFERFEPLQVRRLN